MNHLPVEQGSREWIMARLGIPTASHFHRIMTPRTRKLSAQHDDYLYELLAEHFTGEPMDSFQSAYMARGQEFEGPACKWYQWQTDCEVEPAGFVLRDDGKAGCSPDGFVGDAGLAEIKVLSAPNHIARFLETEADYQSQVQGQLWICEREWCDRVSYNPVLPSIVRRIYRDDAFIADLASTISQFTDHLEVLRERLTTEGWKPRKRPERVVCAHGIDRRVCRVCIGQREPGLLEV